VNQNLQRSGGIILAVLVLALGGYGAWVAWDRGLIGHNPRAPVAEAMEPAVLSQARMTDLRRLSRNQCVPVNIRSPAPEISGMPGIALRATPTSFHITLLIKTQFQNQAGRDKQIRQLDYLAKQGLLVASDVMIDTNEGPRPARNYRMTWAGYAVTQQKNARSLCLNFGKTEYAGIEKIEPRTERMLDHDVYAVTYQNRVKDIPDWAKTAEAKQLFPKLAELTADTRTTVLVVRTREGWRAPRDIEQELASATRPKKAWPQTNPLADKDTPPSPSLAETKQLLNLWMTSETTNARSKIACLPLHLERSGDDRTAGFNRNNSSTREYTLTYYDREGRKPYEYARMARNLHILYALEQGGLASREVLMIEQPAPADTTTNTPTPAQATATIRKPAGLRYRIPSAFMDMLGMNQYGGGCIPAGRLNVELMSVNQNMRMRLTMVSGKSLLEQPPPWTEKVAAHLPALSALRDYGVAVNIGLMYLQRSGEAEKKWRIIQFSPLYPEIAYSEIPAELQPFMPKTTASSPSSTIRAPISGIPQAIPPKVVTLDPQISVAGFPRAPNQAVVEQPEPPPYPAQGAPVHVISVYKGAAYGNTQGHGHHTMYPARITVSDPNALLILLSYEPVDWQIHTVNSAHPKQVLVFGYNESRVTFLGTKKAPTTIAKTGDLYQKWKILLPKTPTKATEETRIDIAQLSEKLTGAQPSSFQTAYQAPTTGFMIDTQTSRFVAPKPRKPAANAPLATLRSMNRGNVGNRLIRSSYGALNDAWSNHAYSAGKVYFEGTIDIHGAAAAHAFANIGMCLSRDDRSAGLQGAWPWHTVNRTASKMATYSASPPTSTNTRCMRISMGNGSPVNRAAETGSLWLRANCIEPAYSPAARPRRAHHRRIRPGKSISAPNPSC
jgi:hypothetical protein